MPQPAVKQSHLRVSRRDASAEETRRAIIEAARELFSKNGYFRTTVEDIARLARVAAVTVYSSVGGKSSLLRILTDIWTDVPAIETCRRSVAELDDPVAILGVVAHTARTMREEFGDIAVLMLVTAPHDKSVSESLAFATSRYRDAFAEVACKLQELDALDRGCDRTQAVDVLWFYFGYWGLYSLHNENGWDYDKAEQWLHAAACRALLKKSLIEQGADGVDP